MNVRFYVYKDSLFKILTRNDLLLTVMEWYEPSDCWQGHEDDIINEALCLLLKTKGTKLTVVESALYQDKKKMLKELVK